MPQSGAQPRKRAGGSVGRGRGPPDAAVTARAAAVLVATTGDAVSTALLSVGLGDRVGGPPCCPTERHTKRKKRAVWSSGTMRRVPRF